MPLSFLTSPFQLPPHLFPRVSIRIFHTRTHSFPRSFTSCFFNYFLAKTFLGTNETPHLLSLYFPLRATLFPSFPLPNWSCLSCSFSFIFASVSFNISLDESFSSYLSLLPSSVHSFYFYFLAHVCFTSSPTPPHTLLFKHASTTTLLETLFTIQFYLQSSWVSSPTPPLPRHWTHTECRRFVVVWVTFIPLSQRTTENAVWNAAIYKDWCYFLIFLVLNTRGSCNFSWK